MGNSHGNEYLLFIKIKENKVIEVSQPFLDYTQYLASDIVGKSQEKAFNMLFKCNKQKEQLAAIIDNLPDAISVLDAEGNFLIANKAKKQVYKDIELKTINDIYASTEFYDEDGKRILFKEMPFYRVLKGQKVEHEIVTAKMKGRISYLDLSCIPLFDGDNKPGRVILSVNDVSEIVAAKQLLREKHEHLEIVMENISDAIFVLDSNGNYLHVNKAAQKYFDQNTLKKFGDTLMNVKYLDLEGNIIVEQDLPFKTVLRNKSADKRIVVMQENDVKTYFDITTIPVMDEWKNISMVIACAADITQHIRNAEMLKLQKDELENTIKLKDEFLSLISHEFKTPLTVINSAVQAMELLCKNEMSERAKKFLGKIRQNSFRQLRLVNNILDITKIGAGQIKIIKKNIDIIFLTKAIIKSVSIFAKQKEINLFFYSRLSRKVIGMDEEKYERILLNLISNAIKFTQKGRAIYVKVSQKKDKVRIQVIDEGVGIPQNKQQTIFERFGQVDNSLTRQAEGTGIGLSLVKLLVKALDGQISVSSEIGKGSTFTIAFPDQEIDVVECPEKVEQASNERLIQSIAVEFSDIYL